MSGSDAVDPELLRQALEVVAAGGAATAEPALAAGFEFNRAAKLASDGRTGEAIAILRDLAAPPAGKHTTPAIGLQAARALAESAFHRAAWDEVIEAEQVAVVHLGALASRTQALFSTDATAAERGVLAGMAAYAAAKTGAVDAAISILERGRTTMIAERLGAGRRAAPPDRRAGPVVHLLASAAGGLALVSGQGPAFAVWLDQLGGKAFGDRLRSYAAALDGVRRNILLGIYSWRAEVASMLEFLQGALGPLLAAFPTGALTVVPTGSLSMLPLAAAMNSSAAARGIAILPSLGLDPERTADAATGQVLVVADPALPSARWEEAGVRGFFARSPDADDVVAVSEIPGGATAGGVLAAFPGGGVAHFACHGAVEIGAPLRSALILPGGGRLSVADILGARIPPLAVAVLSACESGLTGAYLFDEAITLPMALLTAGCAGVVSTLWVVEDLSSALVMLRFYWEWRHQHSSAPLALASAQAWLRATSDLDKCGFVETDLVSARVLSQGEGASLAGQIKARSASMAQNSYAEPYYWAGFYFTGR